MEFDFLTLEIAGEAGEVIEANAIGLAVAGLLIGFLVGLTGMGGGSLMTPILLIVFKFPTVVAIGTDIMYGAITKTFGAYRHYRLGTVNTHIAGWLAVGSVPSSILGVRFIEYLRETYDTAQLDSLITSILGGSLIAVGVILMGRMLYVDEHVHPMYDGTTKPLSKRHRITALIVGLCSGFVLGMTSVGSGTFIGLALVLFFPLSARRIVGTDVFHAAILLWAAGLAHMSVGNVEMAVVGALLVGSIPGVWFGSHLSAKMADKPLKSMIAAVLTVSGTKVMGASTAVLLLTGAGGIIFVLFIVWRAYLHKGDPPPTLPEAPYDDLGMRDLEEVAYPLPNWYADEPDFPGERHGEPTDEPDASQPPADRD